MIVNLGPVFTGKAIFYSVCLPVHQALYEEGSTLKGKNLLAVGANSFVLEKEGKAMLTGIFR